MWDFKNDKPVYIQLAEELKMRIAAGKYKLGERLPTVQELASEARVNPNAVLKALSELEAEGLIITLKTSGRYITDDTEKIHMLQDNAFDELLAEPVKRLKEMGISEDEAVEILRKYYLKQG